MSTEIFLITEKSEGSKTKFIDYQYNVRRKEISAGIFRFYTNETEEIEFLSKQVSELFNFTNCLMNAIPD